MAFAVATCAKYSERFRLIWRIGKKKLTLSAVIRLTYPACAHSFEQTAVGLVVFHAGTGEFPRSVIAESSALWQADTAPAPAQNPPAPRWCLRQMARW